MVPMKFDRINWQGQHRVFGHAWLLFLLAFFLGIFAAVLPWWFVLALCFPVFVGMISWFAPVWSVMFVLALQFGVLSKIVPRIPLGGGGLNPEDLAIPILLFIYAIKNYGILIKKLPRRSLSRRFRLWKKKTLKTFPSGSPGNGRPARKERTTASSFLFSRMSTRS